LSNISKNNRVRGLKTLSEETKQKMSEANKDPKIAALANKAYRANMTPEEYEDCLRKARDRIKILQKEFPDVKFYKCGTDLTESKLC